MSACTSRQTSLTFRHAPENDNAELQMWLRLLACANLITMHLRRRLRREFNISLPTFDILAQIARPPLGPTMGELSRRLMVSSVTELIERLASKGLVIRRKGLLRRTDGQLRQEKSLRRHIVGSDTRRCTFATLSDVERVDS